MRSSRKIIHIIIFILISLYAFSDTITFYFRPPSWADSSPIELKWFNNGNGGFVNMTDQGDGWYTYDATVSSTTSSIDFILRYWQGSNSKTLYDSSGGSVTFTTTTGEIWVDGEAGSSSWITSWTYYYTNETDVVTDSDPDIVDPSATFAFRWKFDSSGR